MKLQRFAKDFQYRIRLIVIAWTFLDFLFLMKYQCTSTIDNQYGTFLINPINISRLLINKNVCLLNL